MQFSPFTESVSTMSRCSGWCHLEQHLFQQLSRHAICCSQWRLVRALLTWDDLSFLPCSDSHVHKPDMTQKIICSGSSLDPHGQPVTIKHGRQRCWQTLHPIRLKYIMCACRLDAPTATLFGFDSNGTERAVILNIASTVADPAAKACPCLHMLCTRWTCLPSPGPSA